MPLFQFGADLFYAIWYLRDQYDIAAACHAGVEPEKAAAAPAAAKN